MAFPHGQNSTGSRRNKIGSEPKLTAKQSMFVDEYLRTANQTRSAEKAGYSHPEVIGSQLLNGRDFPMVAQEVERRIKERREAGKGERDLVVATLIRIALFNPKHTVDANGAVLPLQDMPDDVAQCIAEYEIDEHETVVNGELLVRRKIKVRPWNKMEACKQLAQHLGITKDVPANQVVNIIDWQKLAELGKAAQHDPIEAKLLEVEQCPAPVNPAPAEDTPAADK
jgi:hypothetical protein